MKNRWAKGILVVTGAMVLSTLGIFASDALQGIDSGIENLAGARRAGGCKAGATPLRAGDHVICVDLYEASASKGCPHARPENVLQTEENANTGDCYAATVPDARPWTFISLPQAQRMCAGAGKRLPSSEEWYRIALGTNPNTCTIRETAARETGNGECLSSIGAYDAIGNVWEWVDETVVDGALDGRALPETGYVTSVDENGVAITSSGAPDELYGKDYLWTKAEGTLGMIRGGFYSSADDAGLYSLNASIPTSFATQGIGFRCVEDLL